MVKTGLSNLLTSGRLSITNSGKYSMHRLHRIPKELVPLHHDANGWHKLIVDPVEFVLVTSRSVFA